jgi:hypothetical protein
MEHKICVLSTKVHKCDAFHEDWICLDAQKYVEISSYTTLEEALAICGVSGCDKSCDCRVTAKQRRMRETNMTLKQWQVLLKPVLLTKLLKHSFIYTALVGVTNSTFLF